MDIHITKIRCFAFDLFIFFPKILVFYSLTNLDHISCMIFHQILKVDWRSMKVINCNQGIKPLSDKKKHNKTKHNKNNNYNKNKIK